MTRVYLADPSPDERAALHLLLLDLQLEVVGESADWNTTISQTPISRIDMLLVDWSILPDLPTMAIKELRKSC